MNYKSKIGSTIGLLMLLSVSGISSTAIAQQCLSEAQYPDAWPDSRYSVDSIEGTVIDQQTTLMWMQCSLGQTLTGGGCSGTASNFNWRQALGKVADQNNAGFAGYQNWRLPNIKELRSLAKYNCSDPAINKASFPNTAPNNYWSASPYEGNGGSAWQVNFDSGFNGINSRSNASQVRLVRTGVTP